MVMIVLLHICIEQKQIIGMHVFLDISISASQNIIISYQPHCHILGGSSNTLYPVYSRFLLLHYRYSLIQHYLKYNIITDFVALNFRVTVSFILESQHNNTTHLSQISCQISSWLDIMLHFQLVRYHFIFPVVTESISYDYF